VHRDAYCSRGPFSGWGLGASGDDDGGGEFVVGVEVEELDAAGAAAWGYCRPSARAEARASFLFDVRLAARVNPCP
jgi:hypothetical protein